MRSVKRDEAALLELIHLAYAAGADPERWTALLEQLRDYLGSSTAVLASLDLDGPSCRILHSIGLPPEFINPREAHDRSDNPWSLCERSYWRPGQVWFGRQVVPLHQLIATRFYRVWLKPQGLLHSLRGVLDSSRKGVLIAGLLRSRALGQYEEADVARLSALLPHLRRALRLHRQLSLLRSESQALHDMLDHLWLGLALLDETGRVIFLNQPAEEILARGDGLALRRQRLTATSPGEAAKLHRLLAQAGRMRVESDGSDTLALSRRSGARPLLIFVSPVHAGWSLLGPNGPMVAVFVCDPERKFEVEYQLLRQSYGLTRSEARIAGSLAQGHSLAQIAESFGITAHTARTHLKRIFSKTGVRRQSELVGLILASSQPVRLH